MAHTPHPQEVPVVSQTSLEPLMTSREVAAVLRVTPDRVYELVAAGRLTPLQLVAGGRFRFRVEDVEALIAGRAP
jgi:excisionase family DNA binding protein